jgi:uncharacterized integral membrane protein
MPPWRLIGIIAVLAVLLCFIGFNLDNKCDLSLVFTTIPNVPVYVTIFASFILGMLFSLPFFIMGTHKKTQKTEESHQEAVESPAPEEELLTTSENGSNDSDLHK